MKIIYYRVIYGGHESIVFPLSEDTMRRIARKLRRYGKAEVIRLAFGKGFMIKWKNRKSSVDSFLYSFGPVLLSPPDGRWMENGKEFVPDTDGFELKLLSSGLVVLGTSGFSRFYSRWPNKLGSSQVLGLPKVKRWMKLAGVKLKSRSFRPDYYKKYISPVIHRIYAENVVNLRDVYKELPSLTVRRTLPWQAPPRKEVYSIYFDVLKLVDKYDGKYTYSDLAEKIAKELRIPLWRARRSLFRMSLYHWISYWRGKPVRLEDKGREILRKGEIVKEDFPVYARRGK